MEDLHYQTIRVDMASGSYTSSGTFDVKTEALRGDYESCDGVCMYEDADGGLASYQVGLYDETGAEIQKPTHKNDWIGSTSVPINDRYKRTNFRANGRKVTIRVVTTAALSGNIGFDLVFRLKKPQSAC